MIFKCERNERNKKPDSEEDTKKSQGQIRNITNSEIINQKNKIFVATSDIEDNKNEPSTLIEPIKPLARKPNPFYVYPPDSINSNFSNTNNKNMNHIFDIGALHNINSKESKIELQLENEKNKDKNNIINLDKPNVIVGNNALTHKRKRNEEKVNKSRKEKKKTKEKEQKEKEIKEKNKEKVRKIFNNKTFSDIKSNGINKRFDIINDNISPLSSFTSPQRKKNSQGTRSATNNNYINRLITPRNSSHNQTHPQLTAEAQARKDLENKLVNSYDHENPQYKRRKIKIGMNHNIDMYEYQDRYTNQINFDEDEIERNDLKQVYSCSQNPLSNSEINNYLKKARLFWNYKNPLLEKELCSDFFEECDKVLGKKKFSEKFKNRIKKLIKELKNLVRRGVDLNCHFDEMALKMLHICQYKQKVALLFLYLQLNPFIEEVEEGFKSDITFFQSEIMSVINEGDYELDE